MSLHDKHDYWAAQFRVAVPLKLADNFVRENESRITRDIDQVDPYDLVQYTKGAYAKDAIGGFIVRHGNYVQEILVMLSMGSPVERMLFDLMPLDRPTPGFSYWDKLQQEDPEHPVFKGQYWNMSLAQELAAIIGERVVTRHRAAFEGKMKVIRREAAKFKTVAKVMKS